MARLYRSGRKLQMSRKGRTLKVLSPQAIQAGITAGRIIFNAARGLWVYARSGRAVSMVAGAGVGSVGASAAALATRDRKGRIGQGTSSGGKPKGKTYTKVSNQMADIISPIKKNLVLNRRVTPLDKRTLKLGFNVRNLRFQRCNALNQGLAIPGSLILSHKTVNTNETITPCYLMCLNQTNNNTSLTAGPMYTLGFGDTGSVVLTNVLNQDPSGTVTQFKWIIDYHGQSQAGTTQMNDPDVRYIMNAWYDIRLNCYGANSQPTIYDIMVISMTDDYLDPLEVPSNAQEVADRHAVWQGLIQQYMVNPILPVKYPKKKYKVHTRVRFTLQPTLNIENDATPQSRIVKMFIKDGSLYDYCYHGDGFTGAGADDKLSTNQYVVQNTNVSTVDYADTPQPKARKWLVIRALNTTRSETETAGNTPSFDIVVRKSEYYQSKE